MTHTAKHTPGPWRSYNMSRNKILKQWHIQRDDCRHDIALVSLDVPVDDRERVANLIAAAPAMYEALQDIVEGLTDEITRMVEEGKPDTSRLDYLANKAGLAIAQAEGK